MTFDAQNSSILMKSDLSIFHFAACALGVGAQDPLPS
jgi:hypothetical protein